MDCKNCIHKPVCAITGSSVKECSEFIEITTSEWDLRIDDFEDGFGSRRVPYCKHCGRSVYRHDAGSYCPFCGSTMTNPMR